MIAEELSKIGWIGCPDHGRGAIQCLGDNQCIDGR